MSTERKNVHGIGDDQDKQERKRTENEIQFCDEEKIYTNQAIVSKIATLLRFQELKSCRPVNRLFNDVATKSILSRYRTYPIKMTTAGPKKVMAICDKEFTINKSDTLANFIDLVSTSKLFPCNFIHLDLIKSKTDKPLENEMLQRFFSLQGDLIKQVNIDVHSASKSGAAAFKSFIEHVLLNRLCNLETLDLLDKGVFHNRSILIDLQLFSTLPDVTLPNLSTIDISGVYNLTKESVSPLLKVAPNLKGIYFDTEYLGSITMFMELKRAHQLKNLHFYLELFGYILIFERIVRERPELAMIDNVTLNLNATPPSNVHRVGKILFKAFSSSKNSLRSFKGLWTFKLLTDFGFSIPIFSNVSDLICGFQNNVGIEKWGKELRALNSGLSRQFPHLRSVQLDFSGEEFVPADPELFGGRPIPLVTVRRFEIPDKMSGVCHKIPSTWIKYFCEMFPNLTQAYFSTLMDFNSASGFLWRLERLEVLHFGISLPRGLREAGKDGDYLESNFTGFSREICKQLRENGEGPDPLDVERREFSIVSLKNLRRMLIAFRVAPYTEVKNGDPVSEDSKCCSILSFVTGRYGFGMLPKAVIDIEVKTEGSKTRSVLLAFRLDLEECKKYFQAIEPFVKSLRYKNPSLRR